ncbi:MAG: hypothetical protein HZB39_07980 [Planctomycetes bacterium]|nr:hypothetical protein [Planctomycetota bacterium]
MNSPGSMRAELCACLPMGDVELADAARSAGLAESDLSFLRAANRNARLLNQLARPKAPAALDSREVLERIYESATDDLAVRFLGANGVEPVLSPLRAPHDVDWAAAVLEGFESGSVTADAASELASTLPPTPGWLWLRIRGELRTNTGRPTRPATRVWLRVAALLVAGVAIGLVIASIRGGVGADREVVANRIEFQRVDRPLDASFSLAAIVLEVRHGRR